MTGERISYEVALKLCNEIQAENKRERFPPLRSVCYFCLKNAKGDIEKMCISSEQGCPWVNKRYRSHKGDK